MRRGEEGGEGGEGREGGEGSEGGDEGGGEEGMRERKSIGLNWESTKLV